MENTNPFRLARELVAANGAVITELNFHIKESIPPERWKELLRLIDDQIEEYEATESRLHKDAEGTECADVLGFFSDNWCSKAVVWADAGFVLGVSTAFYMMGFSTEARLPVRRGR